MDASRLRVNSTIYLETEFIKQVSTHVCPSQLRTFSHHSYFYLHFIPVDILWCFCISLFFGINIIISVLNNTVKETPLPHSYLLYCCDIAWWWPKLCLIKHILPSTMLLIWKHERNSINCMYKSSGGWTLGCSKHVEDTVINPYPTNVEKMVSS